MTSPAGADTAVRNYPLLLRRVERLMELNQNLASTLDQERLLRRIVDAARELTDSEAASILLFDPRTDELRFEATTNLEAARLRGLVVPLENSIAGWIVKHAEPLVVPDARADPRWNQSVDEELAFITRSILGVPLQVRDRTIGVLEAINKTRSGFTDDDVITLRWLAAQAAVAIVNARLFEQSDLVSELVHELRTPLTALLAGGQILLRPDLPEAKRTKLVHTLLGETRRLADMTTSFLEMARLESGRVRFAVECFALDELVRECLEVVRPAAAEREVSLEFEAPAGPTALETDRGKVKQVLLNLFTNAVKYNRPGGRVTVRLEPSAERVRVSVTDTGRGIAAEDLPRLFEKFFRAPDNEGYASGTGLGLPIARRLVEALGGEMEVASTLGSGSTFGFSLPWVANLG